jgi:hypothetical protein
MERRAIGLALVVVGLGAGVVAASLPWLDTGGVSRSAFRLVRTVRELAVFERRRDQLAVQAVLALPPVLGVVIVAISLGRRRVAAFLALPAAVGLLGAGVVARRLTGAVGPLVAAIGGAAALIGALLALAPARSRAQQVGAGRADND